MFILSRHDIYVSTANINCSCELKACSIKKSWNPMVPLALPVVPELSAFKRNFYNIEMIQDLYKIICNQNLPKIFKQGEVVCVIGKPFEQGVFGIFYHENREPKEFMKWAKYLYKCLINIF